MTSKFKVQVLRTLDERIKRIVEGKIDDIIDLPNKANILGFINGNTINYVGLASKSLSDDDPNLTPCGLAYLKDPPSDATVKDDLSILVDELKGLSDGDQLNLVDQESSIMKQLFLVYKADKESTTGFSRSIWTPTGPFDKPPKISVLDVSKIYNHSALSRVVTSTFIKDGQELESLAEIKKQFNSETKNFSFTLLDSKFSSKSLTLKNPGESLYDHLTAPDEVTSSLTDVLDQTCSNKQEKEAAIKKACDKWRNKYKERRGPLQFQIDNELETSTGNHKVQLEFYLYINVNETISTIFRRMLSVLLHNINLLESSLRSNESLALSKGSILHLCTFLPSSIDHLVYGVYILPESVEPDYEELKNSRRRLHESYLVSTDRPQFRIAQALRNLELLTTDQENGYLCNVHLDIADKSGIKQGIRDITNGTYTYHHYMQNNINDSGWGCAYRSLQTIISWFKHQAYIYSPDAKPYKSGGGGDDDDISSLRAKLKSENRVPSHEEIQLVLKSVGMPEFMNSKKWIGSQEVCYVLDHLYGISSKFIPVSSGSEMVSKARDLGAHFRTQSTPVMIGGGVLAHTIIGVDFNEKNGDISYLILDPHYTESEDLDKILKKGWCGWKKNSFWDKSAFYNLCLPQRPSQEI